VINPATFEPEVRIVSPSGSSTPTAWNPAAIKVIVEASVRGGTIKGVELYNGETKLNITGSKSSGSNSWVFDWTEIPAGSYALKARAEDNDGQDALSEEVTFSVSNPAPIVRIVAPGSQVIANEPFTIHAEAYDYNDPVEKVEFLVNDVLIGSATQAPYKFTCTLPGGIPPNINGEYYIYARATDEGGADNTVANRVYIQQPSIARPDAGLTITMPASGSNIGIPTGESADVTFCCDAFNMNGGISLIRYQLYRVSTPTDIFIASGDSTAQAPYAWTATVTEAGSYRIYATPYDDQNNVIYFPYGTPSSDFSVTTGTPGMPGGCSVQLIGLPAYGGGGISLRSPGNVTIGAHAFKMDDQWNITELSATVYKDGGGSSNPADLTSLPVNTYSITAKAMDGENELETAPVTVSVYNPMPIVYTVSPASQQSFMSPADVTVTAVAYDTNGTINSVRMGLGTAEKENAQHTGGNTWEKTFTGLTPGTYTVSIEATDNEGETGGSGVTFTVADPGPVVNVLQPLGATSASPAAVAVTAQVCEPNGGSLGVKFTRNSEPEVSAQGSGFNYQYVWEGCEVGTYSIGVNTTSDGQANPPGMPMGGAYATVTNPAPVLEIVEPGQMAMFTTPGTAVTIAVHAYDTNRAIANIECKFGEDVIGTSSSVPCTFTWDAPSAGQHMLTVTATDNDPTQPATTTQGVTVSVTNLNPVIEFLTPKPYMEYWAPATVTAKALIYDYNGSISSVTAKDEDENALSVSEEDGLYVITYHKAMEGSHDITVTATDNEGATVSSTLTFSAVPVNLTVGNTNDATEETPGVYMQVNDNDDNGNDVPDNDASEEFEDGVVAEGDLVTVMIPEPPQGQDYGVLTLHVGSQVKVWTTERKNKNSQLNTINDPYDNDERPKLEWKLGQDPIDRVLYLEGVQASSSLQDCKLTLTYTNEGESTEDLVNVTVLKLEIAAEENDVVKTPEVIPPVLVAPIADTADGTTSDDLLTLKLVTTPELDPATTMVTWEGLPFDPMLPPPADNFTRTISRGTPVHAEVKATVHGLRTEADAIVLQITGISGAGLSAADANNMVGFYSSEPDATAAAIVLTTPSVPKSYPAYPKVIQWDCTGGKIGDIQNQYVISRGEAKKCPLKFTCGVSSAETTAWIVKVALNMEGISEDEKNPVAPELPVNAMLINSDDDNENGVADLQETAIRGEDDLKQASLTLEPAELNGGTLALSMSGGLAAWTKGDKDSTAVTSWNLSEQQKPPDSVFVEGRSVNLNPGESMELRYTWGGASCTDKVCVGVDANVGTSSAQIIVYRKEVVNGVTKYVKTDRPVGGDIFVGVIVKLGSANKLAEQDFDNFRLVATEDDTSTHAELSYPLGALGGDREWQVRTGFTAEREEIWSAGSAANNPYHIARDGGSLTTTYRAMIPWTTTQAHNGRHTVMLYDNATPSQPVTLRYQVWDATANNNLGDWDPTIQEETVKKSTADVQNLVIKDLKSSNGTVDYFKYDPNGDDSLKRPEISFKIEDKGDPHKYGYMVFMRQTGRGSWDSHDYYMTNWDPSLKKYVDSNAGDTVTATWNGALTHHGEPDKAERGTYTYDVTVYELDGYNEVDKQYFKTYCLQIPDECTVNGLVRKGHKVWVDELDDGSIVLKCDYYLRDYTNSSAKQMQLVVIDDLLTERSNVSGEVEINILHNGDGNGIICYTDSKGEENLFEWKVIFTGTDQCSAATHRNHDYQRMLAVNDGTWEKQGWRSLTATEELKVKILLMAGLEGMAVSVWDDVTKEINYAPLHRWESSPYPKTTWYPFVGPNEFKIALERKYLQEALSNTKSRFGVFSYNEAKNTPQAEKIHAEKDQHYWIILYGYVKPGDSDSGWTLRKSGSSIFTITMHELMHVTTPLPPLLLLDENADGKKDASEGCFEKSSHDFTAYAIDILVKRMRASEGDKRQFLWDLYYAYKYIHTLSRPHLESIINRYDDYRLK
jgi:hypothetical protein